MKATIHHSFDLIDAVGESIRDMDTVEAIVDDLLESGHTEHELTITVDGEAEDFDPTDYADQALELLEAIKENSAAAKFTGRERADLLDELEKVVLRYYDSDPFSEKATTALNDAAEADIYDHGDYQMECQRDALREDEL